MRRQLHAGLHRRAAVLVLALAFLLLHLASPAHGVARDSDVNGFTLLTAADHAIYRKAFEAAKRRQWQNALKLAERASDPLPRKVLRWLYYTQPQNLADYREIDGFATEHPHWPRLSRLQRRAEEAVAKAADDDAVVDWFRGRAPVTGDGRVRLAEALMGGGASDLGVQWLRYAWINNTFSRSRAKAIYRRHRGRLRPDDHLARLDRLLWDGHRRSAQGLLSLVSPAQRSLARARMALMARAAGVDAKVAAVPRELKQAPGLIYERARWRRRAGLDAGARDLLDDPLPDVGRRPEKWWPERRVASRDALDAGEPEQAYRIAAYHGLAPGGSDFAEAEFLSGWIALRYLTNGDAALVHFSRLYDNVSYPISVARAAYWTGRAHAALGDADKSAAWLEIAAGYPSAFYGQLASEALGGTRTWRPEKDPTPDEADVQAFNQLELVQVVHRLHELGQADHIRPFLLRLAATRVSPGQMTLTATLAQTVQRPELAVRAAKLAVRSGTAMFQRGYPLLAMRTAVPEPALVHAVIRQESEFNSKAVSRASARGLMQLLPSTAKVMARQLRRKHSTARLFDPAHNILLGTAYLDGLLDRFEGSYVLAVAAYNAGPTRVRRWIRRAGDPRDPAVDIIDWIERIPLSETRNYVQRVMENLQVYRARISDEGVRVVLSEDLARAHRSE